MRTVSVTDAKARLNELVEEVASTHELIVITRHGQPSVVLLTSEDLESLRETVYWLSQSGLRESVAEAERDVTEGWALDSAALRRSLGRPQQ